MPWYRTFLDQSYSYLVNEEIPCT